MECIFYKSAIKISLSLSLSLLYVVAPSPLLHVSSHSHIMSHLYFIQSYDCQIKLYIIIIIIICSSNFTQNAYIQR